MKTYENNQENIFEPGGRGDSRGNEADSLQLGESRQDSQDQKRQDEQLPDLYGRGHKETQKNNRERIGGNVSLLDKKETQKIVKVALYARVSTEEQKENFSLAAQIELLRKHAADNGYEIFDEYVDGGYSGTSFERPRFQKLMDDAKQNRFSLILVYKIDRFFRSNKDLLNVVYDLEGMGVNIRSITEPFDTTNYLGKFILSLFGSIAELERNTFLERSKSGKLRRAREGYYSGSSPAKFGYNYIKETRKLEINEKEAGAVRKIYEVYTQPDSSLIKTTRALRKLDYRAKEGSLMREDVVHDVLRDPIYTGRWYANRHGKNGTLKPREEWIEVKVPQIVSEEIFERTQELLEARKNYSERNAKYPYLLQGMVKCGDCGNTITGTSDKQFQVRNGKSYGPYFKLYYRCTHFAKNKYGKHVNCQLKYVQAQKLESVVWRKIEEILENPGLIEKAVRQEKEIKTKSEGTLKQDIKRIDLQLQGLIKEEQRILEAYRQNIISLGQLKQQVEGITKSKEALEKTKREIRELLQQDSKIEISSAVDYVKKLKEGIGKFTYETKKRILHLFDTIITLNINGIVDILIHIPKDISAAFQPAFSGSSPDILSHFDPPRPISWRGNTGKCLQLHFETTLPNEKRLVKTGVGPRNYTTIYVGLTPELARKLGNLAKKEGKTESEVLRKILDAYFQYIKRKGLFYEPLRKTPSVGLRVLPRTIRKEQDARLRELCEKTGRKISELVREAVKIFSG